MKTFSNEKMGSSDVGWLAMDFLNGTLVEVFWHKFQSCQTQVFVWFSALVFLIYKILFLNGLEFSCFAVFLMDFHNLDKV